MDIFQYPGKRIASPMPLPNCPGVGQKGFSNALWLCGHNHIVFEWTLLLGNEGFVGRFEGF